MHQGKMKFSVSALIILATSFPCLSVGAEKLRTVAADHDTPNELYHHEKRGLQSTACSTVNCAPAAGREETLPAEYPNFNMIPSGGWAAHVTVLNGLEYLYASPCSPSSHYFDAFPDHTNQGSCSANNFPPCVQWSGFRLPTEAEINALLASGPEPPCAAEYSSQTFNHCDGSDYDGGFLYTQSGCLNFPTGACETVYVRPVGTSDSCVPCFSCKENNPCYPLRTPYLYYYESCNEFKFIQCSQWGQCFEMPCAPGTRWSQDLLTCVHAHSYGPPHSHYLH